MLIYRTWTIRGIPPVKYKTGALRRPPITKLRAHMRSSGICFTYVHFLIKSLPNPRNLENQYIYLINLFIIRFYQLLSLKDEKEKEVRGYN